MILLESKKVYKFDPEQSNEVSSYLKRLYKKENHIEIKEKILELIEIFEEEFKSLDEISKKILLIKKQFSDIYTLEEGMFTMIKKKHMGSKKLLKRLIISLGMLATFASCDIMSATMSSDQDIFDSNTKSFYNQSTEGIYYVRLDESFINELIQSLKEYERTLDATVLKKYNISIEDMGEDIGGKYSTVSRDITINSYLPNSYWFSVLVHELTHAKQDTIGYDYASSIKAKSYPTYITNPMEINANFNSILYLSKLDEVETWKYNTIMADDVLVSVLLTYQIDRNYNYTDDAEIINVHEYVKKYSPSAYKDFQRIKNNENLIKDYFGM